jgi:ribosome-associated protein
LPEIAEVRAAVRARLSPQRAAHSERVAGTAVDLAGRHGLDASAAELAGWLHDWCREVPAAEIVATARVLGLLDGRRAEQVVASVLHGPVAARTLPERWPDLPPAVLAAIDRHTTGDPEMTAFDCLVYVADLVEPAHAFAGVEELRALAASGCGAVRAERRRGRRPRAVRTAGAEARGGLIRGRHPLDGPPACAVDPAHRRGLRCGGGGIGTPAEMGSARVERIGAALLAKKALDVTVMDIAALSSIGDQFVVASGRSRTAVQALADAVRESMEAAGERPLRVEGYGEARWVCLDFGDIIVHLFQDEVRRYFDLERLWGDAPQERLTELAAATG